ncbi:unnamed protein product, partial [Sphagnum compactum]
YKGFPLIPGCGTNAHHTRFRSSDINQRGDELINYIQTTELTFMNQGNTLTEKKNKIQTTWKSGINLEKQRKYYKNSNNLDVLEKFLPVIQAKCDQAAEQPNFIYWLLRRKVWQPRRLNSWDVMKKTRISNKLRKLIT